VQNEYALTTNVHVVPDFILLDFTAFALNQLLDNERSYRVGCVALLRVGLDHDTAVNGGFMVVLVLGCVVRMQSVAHVGGKDERLGDALGECARSGREAV
jgi:hypothetical protein